ncbi:RagB/SusD family nutrient uptake outer membrane protein [Echinicola vietnamensis]|uniref:RagB/SusD family protein n=1 Tax=Echinicola vietnamensis (strain DSM 17526 / LMG 23754 / KMM 6221) TaxID=926556 RepID=L0G2T5_ECHVK|nr:RagB/SusD family nutrient uptake outer membrane protein [Echinicola vietnamensis]AGA80509.1 RagB/SusD family protein [Echinicola vietnamensis DSM 17526]
MKNIILLVGAVVSLMGCNNDFLELTPGTELGETEDFWNNESSVETYSNGFYGYIDRDLITEDFSSDNSEHIGNPPAIRRGIYSIPTSLGSGGWSWGQLRDINYFIENVSHADLEGNVKSRSLALARFFRAWFYYDKVRQFGDVPWYGKVLDTNDEDLYKPRDSRILVMDSVRKDLDYAIAHLPAETFKNRISKWTALALKSRICLYEGTWRKYHTEAALSESDEFLEEAAEASRSIMDAAIYSLFQTGNADTDYFELFQPKDAHTEEVILARSSDTQTFYYTPLFTSTSNGNFGATRDLVGTYLMKDGRTFQQAYPQAQKRDTMSYFNEFRNRDPRLSQTLVSPGYVRVGTEKEAVSDFSQNVTGYMVHKRVGPPIEDQGGGYRDVIIFRYAEVLLNYAEAKAELGELGQQGIDQTINPIRERVGMPHLSLPVEVDGFLDRMYDHTSDPLVLEIRRERRVELAFEGFRTDDLKRWKEGHLFREKYEGIYVKGLEEYIDLNGDGNPNLYVLEYDETPPADQIEGVQYFRMSEIHGLSEDNQGRIVPYNAILPGFEDHEYLKPIPTEELTLNPELEQNPGW